MQDVLHLTEEEKQQAIQDEQDFQHYVTGDRASVSAMRELIGFKAYELSGMEAYCDMQLQNMCLRFSMTMGKASVRRIPY